MTFQVDSELRTLRPSSAPACRSFACRRTDSAQDVIDCEREIERIEKEAGIPVGTTGIMAAIESANGVLNAASIAKASDRLIGIALGAEDYVTDLKTTRSDGIELLFARSMILSGKGRRPCRTGHGLFRREQRRRLRCRKHR